MFYRVISAVHEKPLKNRGSHHEPFVVLLRMRSFPVLVYGCVVWNKGL